MSDVWGGLAASTMLLPQSMAFGVALLAPHGVSPAVGATAGLLCAIALSMASGISGGTRGLVSSPTPPMFILLSSALSLIAANMGTEGNIPAALVALVVLTGIAQIIIGASGGGRLIKFIPYSVVVGFLSGAAILMLVSQIAPLSAGRNHLNSPFMFAIPWLTAFVTFAVTFLVPRLTKKIPATLLGLLGGTVFFHILTIFASAPIPSNWVIGKLPALGSINFGFDSSLFASLPWGMLIAAALASAVLASLNTLLTSVVADVATETRHNARKELIGQGFGHIISGLTGGIAGAGTAGATALAINSGGRRLVGVFTSLSLLALVAVGGSLTALLPIAVLAGIIIRVGFGMFETDILKWLTRRESRSDAVIAILVTTVTVVYDLMVAVGLGVSIAVIMYLRNQIKESVIHRRFFGSEFHSVIQRTKNQRLILKEKGDRIVICELKGDLFFAKADSLFEELEPFFEQARWLILQMRRVRRVDLTGAKILQQLVERVHKEGGEIIFCEVHEKIGLGQDVGKSLLETGYTVKDVGARTFIGLDEALEYAENALLKSENVGFDSSDDKLDLSLFEILSGMDDSLLSKLKERLKFQTFKTGEMIFQEGDFGAELFFVLEGEVDIRLDTSERHYTRLANYPPGTVFGEIAFLDPGERTSDAVAVRDTKLAGLHREDFRELSREYPKAAIGLLYGLSLRQSEALRWSAQEIQRLGEW